MADSSRSALAGGGFLPGIVRILIWRFSPPARLNVRRLGVTELLLGIAFGLMLAAAYLNL